MAEHVLVCVEYIEPSVRHVPWRLPVNGQPALGLLLRRLSAGCASTGRRTVICTDGHRLHEVRDIAEAHGWTVFGSSTGLLPAALIEFTAQTPGADDLLLCSSRDVVPDSAASARVLAAHCRGGADVTLAADLLLDGLVPVIVRSSSLQAVNAGCREARDVRHLASMLRWNSRGLQVLRLSTEQFMPDVDHDTLPALPAIDDCWTQQAARDVMTVASDKDAGRIFRARLLALRDEIPQLRPGRPASRRIRTVLYAAMRTAFSGAENSLFTLIANLDSTRYRAVAVFPFECKLAEKLRGAGIETLVAGWDYSTFTPRNLSFCRAVLDAYEPAIVHVDVVPNPPLMVTAKARGIRVVGHLRELPDMHVPPIISLPDRVIAVSDFVARRLRRYNMAAGVVTIHNSVRAPNGGAAVDPDAQRRAYRIPDNAFVVTMVSRLTATKKIDLFLTAFQQVLAQAPSAWALIVGEPASHDLPYAQELRRLAGQHGIEHRITWVPFEEDIQRVFAATDVLVLCCSTEPFPRCVLEALASGVSAIVPDRGGATELVEHGDSGLLFKADSSGALADAVLRVIHDEHLQAALRRQARARAAAFDVPHHVGAVQSLYDELCQTVGEPA